MLHHTPATSVSSAVRSPSPDPTQPPDFDTNAERFAFVERLIKSIVDSLPDPARCAPVVEVAKKLLGRVRFVGHAAALTNPLVSIDIEALPLATRWAWAMTLADWISDSWEAAEIESYEVGESLDAILHEMAGLDVATLREAVQPGQAAS